MESKAVKQSIDSFSNNVKEQLLDKVRLYTCDRRHEGHFLLLVGFYKFSRFKYIYTYCLDSQLNQAQSTGLRSENLALI